MLCCKSPSLTTCARAVFHPKWTLTIPSTNPRATQLLNPLRLSPQRIDNVVIHHLAHTLLPSVRDQRPRGPNTSLKEFTDRLAPRSPTRKSCVAPSSARSA